MSIQIEEKHCIHIARPRFFIMEDGVLMQRWDATSRYLTWWETRMFFWFNAYPKDILPPIKVQDNTIRSAPSRL